MLETIVPRALFAVGSFAGAISVALQSGIIPDVPTTDSPLAWAFMAVVAFALGGAGWVVRHELTAGVSAREKMAEAFRAMAVTMAETATRQVDVEASRNLAHSQLVENLDLLTAKIEELVVYAQKSGPPPT